MENMETIESNLKEISGRLRSIELEVAERRSVNEVIKIVGYIVAIIVATIGFFGFREVSDMNARMDGIVSDSVESQLDERIKDFKQAADFVTALDSHRTKIAELSQQFEAKIRELEKVNVASNVSDIESEFMRLVAEVAHRRQAEVDFDRNDPFAGTLMDETWRVGVFARLNAALSDEKLLEQVDSTTIFNLAQAIREMRHREMLNGLVSSLPDDPDLPEIQAMRTAILLDNATGADRAALLDRLMLFPGQLSERSPQIVLSEVWNGAESTRSYTRLIEVLETAEKGLEESGRPVISYLNLLTAEAYLRRGFAGDKRKSEGQLIRGVSRLSSESPYSQWFQSSVEKTEQLAGILEE